MVVHTWETTLYLMVDVEDDERIERYGFLPWLKSKWEHFINEVSNADSWATVHELAIEYGASQLYAARKEPTTKIEELETTLMYHSKEAHHR